MSAFEQLRQLLADYHAGRTCEDRLRRLLLGDDCRLLAAARERRARGDLFAGESLPDWAGFASGMGPLLCPNPLETPPGQNPSDSTLAARVTLIRAALSDAEPERIQQQLGAAIAMYHRLQGRADWSLDTLQITDDQVRYPAWRTALGNQRWRGCFDRLAAELGWFDPALALAARTIARIQPRRRDPRRARPASAPPRQVRTWVLLVVDGAGDLDLDAGLVAPLVIRKVPGGCGFLYPDPRSMGYLKSPDASFQESLRNAWFQVMRPVFGRVSYDLIWSVPVTHPGDRLPIAPCLRGRSGELAIAAALRALRDDEDLDPWTVLTGMFASPLDPRDQTTAPVEEVEAKLRAKEFGSRLRAAELTDLVVDTAQQPGDEQIHKADVHRATDFNSAYEHAARWAVMTRTANRNLAEHAAVLLGERCKANVPGGYVPSPLSESKTPRGVANTDDQQWERLDEDQRQSVVTAAVPEWRRVAFFADSGVGKTTFLVHCEHQIALAQTGLLPVRYDKLSARAWDNEDRFLTNLANKMSDYLPSHREQPKRIREWLLRLRAKGRLVFLLDAIDQTDERHIQALHGWLSGDGGVRDCRVYVTGRPWTRQSSLFDSPDPAQPWTIIRVDMLDPDQIGAFLSRDQWDRLRRHFEINLEEEDEDEEQDEDDDDDSDQASFTEDDLSTEAQVLRVPVVLGLLKNLADSEVLDGLTNRERIYQAALERPWDERLQSGGLLGKGLATVKKSPFAKVLPDTPVARRIGELSRLLGQTAWRMVREGNFAGFAAERQFDALADQIEQFARQQQWGPEVLKYLDQIGVFQIRELIDIVAGSSTSLEWRHLSFCEYFAGVHLAEALTAAEQTEALAHVLDNLAARWRAMELLAGGAQQQVVSPADRWRWVFRYALSRACAKALESGDASGLNHLARQLIAHGNPYVVYESMRADGIEQKLDKRLSELARWLVHQTWDNRDLRGAWKSERPPEVDAETLAILHTLFDRRYRNGPVLPPAWQLVESCLPGGEEAPGTPLQQAAVAIRELFIGDFDPEVAGERALSEAERRLLTEFLSSFVTCPPGDFDYSKSADQLREVGQNEYVFRMGASPNDKEAYDDERPRHWVRLGGFRMSEFCVTSGVLELMDPAHFWYRDQFSRDDDQPALWVNWYTARLFGLWLTELARRAAPGSHHAYRLPTECEWEFAARGGSGAKWWWGDVFKPEHCNNYRQGADSQTLGRSRTTPLHRNGFGLYHMAGNNWQWCEDVFDADWYAKRTGVSGGANKPHDVAGECHSDGGYIGVGGRVCRGGSFNNHARACRSSYRFLFGAGGLYSASSVFGCVVVCRFPSRPLTL